MVKLLAHPSTPTIEAEIFGLSMTIAIKLVAEALTKDVRATCLLFLTLTMFSQQILANKGNLFSYVQFGKLTLEKSQCVGLREILSLLVCRLRQKFCL